MRPSADGAESTALIMRARIRRKAPTKDDVWQLDEVVMRINGQKCWLWRAVDQDGNVQTRRNTKAARRLLARFLKKQVCRQSV